MAFCASSTSPRTTHIFVTPSRSRRRSSRPSTTPSTSTSLFDMHARFELHAAREQARDRRGVGHDRGALVPRWIGEMPYELNEGDGALRAEDRPPHDGRVGRKWQMGTIQLDSQMPARFGHVHGRRQRRAHAVRRPSARSAGSLERFIGILIEHYGGAFPFWLAPVQVRIIPVGEDHREAARALAENSRTSGWRSTTRTRPSASGSGTPRWRRSAHHRLRRPRVGGRSPSRRGGEQSTRSLDDW